MQEIIAVDSNDIIAPAADHLMSHYQFPPC